MARKSPLAENKVRLIQVAKRSLGLADDDYRDILWRVAGVTSSKDLTDEDFGLLMDVFARLGFVSTSASRNFGRREGFATAGQVAAIRSLWNSYTNGQGTEQALGQWLSHTWNVSALRFVTAEQAPKIIAALRSMCGRASVDAHVVA